MIYWQETSGVKSVDDTDDYVNVFSRNYSSLCSYQVNVGVD